MHQSAEKQSASGRDERKEPKVKCVRISEWCKLLVKPRKGKKKKALGQVKAVADLTQVDHGFPREESKQIVL